MSWVQNKPTCLHSHRSPLHACNLYGNNNTLITTFRHPLCTRLFQNSLSSPSLCTTPMRFIHFRFAKQQSAKWFFDYIHIHIVHCTRICYIYTTRRIAPIKYAYSVSGVRENLFPLFRCFTCVYVCVCKYVIRGWLWLPHFLANLMAF